MDDMSGDDLYGARRGRGSINNTLQELQTGSNQPVKEWFDWTYWDTFIIPSVQTETRLFTGAAGRNPDVTNFPGSGQFPQAQKLFVKAIKIFYIQSTSSPLTNFRPIYNYLASSTVQYQQVNKAPAYQKTMLEMFGLQMAVSFDESTRNAATGMYKGIDLLNRKIVIAAQTSFDFVINTWGGAPPAEVVGDKIRIGMSGILFRAI